MTVDVRRMNEADIAAVTHLYELCFPELQLASEAIQCLLSSFPKSQCFVAEQDNVVVGLIFWMSKSGFRKEAFVELEQVAVHTNHRRKGIGTLLIQKSLPLVALTLAEQAAVLKTIVINSVMDAATQLLFQKVLGAELIAKIDCIHMMLLVAKNAEKVRFPLVNCKAVAS